MRGNVDERLLYHAVDDSMIGDRIFEGDILFIDPGAVICSNLNGIYLVEADGKRLLRRIEYRNSKYRLYASNPSIDDSVYSNVKILGAVVMNVIKF